MINAALLESCDNLYNFTKHSINELVLEEKIEKMKILYPMELVYIVQQMVQIDEKLRLDFIQLEKMVQEQYRVYSDKKLQPHVSHVVTHHTQPMPQPPQYDEYNNTQQKVSFMVYS